MLITDDIAYLELHKTGCSHVLKILKAIYGDACQIHGKHNTYDTVFHPSERAKFDALTKVGNIRNPWDWYVSLWSFGCQGEGGLHSRLTVQRDLKWHRLSGIRKRMRPLLGQDLPRRSTQYWKSLYADVNDVQAFRAWLRAIIAEPGHSLGEGYKVKPLSKVAGLMTYRFMKLYTYRDELAQVDSPSGLALAFAKDGFVEVMLRNEYLHDDLKTHAVTLGTTLEHMTEVLSQFTSRTNASHRNRDFRAYYDDETKALVARADAYLIDTFGYTFD